MAVLFRAQRRSKTQGLGGALSDRKPGEGCGTGFNVINDLLNKFFYLRHVGEGNGSERHRVRASPSSF